VFQFATTYFIECTFAETYIFMLMCVKAQLGVNLLTKPERALLNLGSFILFCTIDEKHCFQRHK